MRISDWSSDVCSSDLLRDGELREYDIHPEEFGFAMAGSQNLRVNDAAESRTRVLEALANTPGVARDIVAFNAGAAIYAARRAERSEEHTSELQSLMRISYAVFCLKKKKYRRNEQA